MDRLRQLIVRRPQNPWLLFGLLCCCCLAAADAWARPGGGGNYTGRGSGDFGGGGSGGGDGFGFLLYLVFAYPEVGVPVLIVVAVFAGVKKLRSPDRTTARAVKTLEQPAPKRTTDLSTIQSRDPLFREDDFLSLVEKLVFELQDAWCRGNMDPTRPNLSDGLMRRFETQLAINRHHGLQNAMADQQILGLCIHDAEHQVHFDTIHVYLRASVRDVEVDASLTFDDAVRKAQKAPREEYAEIWSFLRSTGAKTRETGKNAGSTGVAERYCPNCGAELSLGQTTRCSHCSALVNSGEYSWVLAEITQPEEWQRGGRDRVPGEQQLAKRDPGFDRQAVEDRASYLFWRWIQAKVLATDVPLAKIATPELRGEIAEFVRHGPAALFKVAVGGADLIACEPGDHAPDKATSERDRIHIKILWSSARSNKDLPSHQAHVLTLSRNSGATSTGALSHARCPECHGPLTENDAPTCDYCGVNLASGENEWVLEQVRFPEEVRINQNWHPASTEAVAHHDWSPFDMGSQRDRTLLLMRMAAVVVADGTVTKKEQKLLEKMSKRWNVPLETVKPILTGTADSDHSSMLQPNDPQAFLSGLVQAALVDGRVDKQEAKLLVDIGGNLGFKETEVRALWR